jgi:AcrR family transcriptional regulator
MRILAAAQICFAKYGFRETTNKLIADLASITPGTIYHYFANKQNLFLTVHEEIQNSVIGSLERTFLPQATLGESVDAMMRALVNVYSEQPNWISFSSVVRTEARRNPEISAAHNDRAWRAMFRNLAEAAVASGEIDPANMLATRAVLSAIVLGLNQHAIEATPENHAECMRGLGLLLRGLLVKPPRVEGLPAPHAVRSVRTT